MWSQLQHAASSSLTSDQTWVSCTGSTVSEPLDHQGSPGVYFLWGVNSLIYKRLVSIWEKAMAPHSSTLAWKISWTEEPGRLQSMRSLSRTWLSDFTFTFRFHALEKEMATHSSVLAWRVPGTGEPGALLSTGSYGVRHDWSNLAAAAAVSIWN